MTKKKQPKPIGTAMNGEVIQGDFVSLERHYMGAMHCGFVISEGSIGSGNCKTLGFQVEEASGKRVFYPGDCTRIVNRDGFPFKEG